jgi:hypothetical protein
MYYTRVVYYAHPRGILYIGPRLGESPKVARRGCRVRVYPTPYRGSLYYTLVQKNRALIKKDVAN